eukprot:jgi/Mesvir1/5698/Mv15712-RA.2
MCTMHMTDFWKIWHAIFPRRKDVTWAWVKKKVIKHYLPLGITLATKDIREAFSAWPSFLYALAAVLGITPLYGFAAVHIPFSPSEFRRGLALFATVPTTLTSGVTMVTQAGGNRAFALLTTVVTNLAGVGTVPLYLNVILSSSDVRLDVLDLFKRLVLTLLVPLIIGKLCLQFIPWVSGFTQRHKTALSLVASTALIITVWITLCQSADSLKSQSGKSIMIMITAAVVLHVAYLIMNVAATKLLRTGVPEAKGVIIMCSQKTLPVALTILSNLSEAEIGSKGLVAVPCIVCHMAQLFIDSVLVSYWASKWEKGSTTSSDHKGVETVDTGIKEGGDQNGMGEQQDTPDLGSLPSGAANGGSGDGEHRVDVTAEAPDHSNQPSENGVGADATAGDAILNQGTSELMQKSALIGFEQQGNLYMSAWSSGTARQGSSRDGNDHVDVTAEAPNHYSQPSENGDVPNATAGVQALNQETYWPRHELRLAITEHESSRV